MGEELRRVVEHVRANSRGIVSVDLARLNLVVGKPLSRMALEIPDEPKLVGAAWEAAREIVGGGKK
jgi:hypothetical protein